METPYTYLFIRKDLTIPQQIVQSAHAAACAGYAFGEHSHLICFGIDSQDDLIKAAQHLERHGIRFEMFFEPDYQTGHTAICTEPLQGERRKPMKRFTLFTHRECVV